MFSVLFFKAVLRDKNCTLAKIFRRGPEDNLVLLGKLKNSLFLNSKDSLTESVLSKRSASILQNPS